MSMQIVETSQQVGMKLQNGSFPWPESDFLPGFE